MFLKMRRYIYYLIYLILKYIMLSVYVYIYINTYIDRSWVCRVELGVSEYRDMRNNAHLWNTSNSQRVDGRIRVSGLGFREALYTLPLWNMASKGLRTSLLWFLGPHCNSSMYGPSWTVSAVSSLTEPFNLDLKPTREKPRPAILPIHNN